MYIEWKNQSYTYNFFRTLFFGWHFLKVREIFKKREYIKTFDLKEGGGQFENFII